MGKKKKKLCYLLSGTGPAVINTHQNLSAPNFRPNAGPKAPPALRRRKSDCGRAWSHQCVCLLLQDLLQSGTREEPGTLTQGAPVFPGSSRLGIEPKTPGWLVQDPTTRPIGDLITSGRSAPVAHILSRAQTSCALSLFRWGHATLTSRARTAS